jgi:CubicO group peptidase (beta-lactamase class C family)
MPRLLLPLYRKSLPRLLLFAILFSLKGKSQSGSLDDLKELQGRYQYFNNLSIQFAASPRDGVLYAILDEAKYPLKKLGPDFFMDRQGSHVVFERDPQKRISGYRLHEKNATNFFRRISTADFPESMWYARRSVGDAPYKYSYTVPTALNDGLQVGSLQQAAVSLAPIALMAEEVAQETHKNIHSILLIRHGKLVLEEYFYQYDREKLHQLRSATKSVVSALVGIAIDKKLIPNKDAKVLSFFPDYRLDNMTAQKEQITLEHLLTNQSGLACEDSDPSSPGNEIKMGLTPDWPRFILDLPMLEAPGEVGRYCSGGVILLGRIVEKASAKNLSDFAAENLFSKLGITNYKWVFKPDNSNAEDFCQLHMRPRDMAKLGLLYLNEGRWNDTQVISRDWVKASLSSHSTVNKTDYGYLWWRQWLNVDGKRVDGITAKGNGGQRIYLWPTLDMVVVITGGSYNEQSPSDEIQIKYLLPATMK